MVVMLEVLVNAIDVSVAYVNLEVAMNSGDVSTVAFSAISTTSLWLLWGWFICHENLSMESNQEYT
jgi:hypothetical protein